MTLFLRGCGAWPTSWGAGRSSWSAVILIPLPGPGWLVVGIGLLVLGREVRWARGALVRLERFMRRHGMRTSLRRLIARRQRERPRGSRPHPSVQPMDAH